MHFCNQKLMWAYQGQLKYYCKVNLIYFLITYYQIMFQVIRRTLEGCISLKYSSFRKKMSKLLDIRFIVKISHSSNSRQDQNFISNFLYIEDRKQQEVSLTWKNREKSLILTFIPFLCYICEILCSFKRQHSVS